MELKDIGLRIKHQRLAAEITQKQLAEKIGTTWEMISRYETGKSSPLRKIGSIAEALDIPVSKLLGDTSLEDGAIPYFRNTVPLIDSPFTDLKSALDETKHFYSAPDWIVHTGIRPFAMEASIASLQTAKIDNNGILYLSIEKPSSPDDLVLTHDGSAPAIQPYSMKKTSSKILGVVLAWEKRFR
jgi:transcriptional regulator with XRE-family HTH domain